MVNPEPNETIECTTGFFHVCGSIDANQHALHRPIGFLVQPYSQSVAKRLESLPTNGAPRPRQARFTTVSAAAAPVTTTSAPAACLSHGVLDDGFGQQPAKGREDPHAERGSYGAVNRDVHARRVRRRRAGALTAASSGARFVSQREALKRLPLT